MVLPTDVNYPFSIHAKPKLCDMILSCDFAYLLEHSALYPVNA